MTTFKPVRPHAEAEAEAEAEAGGATICRGCCVAVGGVKSALGAVHVLAAAVKNALAATAVKSALAAAAAKNALAAAAAVGGQHMEAMKKTHRRI